MSTPRNGSRERRGKQRFPLRMHIDILRIGGSAVDFSSVSENVSSSGLAFQTNDWSNMSRGARVKFSLRLQGGTGTDPAGPEVNLACEGRIVRVQRLENQSSRVVLSILKYRFARQASQQALIAEQRR